MGTMRKPDNVLKLSGSYRADRHGDPAEKLDVEPEIPQMPDYLCGRAADEWQRVTKALHGKKLLTVIDLAILAQYCVLYAKFAEKTKDLSAADHAQLRIVQQELGFTPSSRGKIVIDNGKKKDGPRPLR